MDQNRTGLASLQRTVALVGHNVISLSHAARIACSLPSLLENSLGVRARRAERQVAERWRFLTPLAPGSDYVLADSVLRYLERREQSLGAVEPWRFCVAAALPPATLVAAWQRQRGLTECTADGRQLAPPGMRDELVVDLLRELGEERPGVERLAVPLPAGSESDVFESANDYLVREADELVIALDPHRYSRPGLDLDDWRQASADEFPRGGTGALLHAWLNRRPRARSPLKPYGVHWIDLGEP